MSIPIREYLAQRRTDIQAQIKLLRAELSEVDVAEKALAAVSGETPVRRDRGTAGSGARKTLKEMATEILQDHPDGLEANSILAEIERRYFVTVQRESLSPQLSRLGQEGVLNREGWLWKLSNYSWIDALSRSSKDETPSAGTPDVSEEAV